MNPPRTEGAPPAINPPQSDPVLAVIDFEPKRVTLRPIDFVRYALYGLVITVLAATSAYLVAARGHSVYAARSEILFERRSEQSTGFLREDRDLTTQLVTMRTRAVLAPVASANGLSVDALSKKLQVSIVDSSEVIRVQVDDRSVTRAKALVGAISKRYLAGAESPAAGETRRFLEGRLARINGDVARLSAQSAQLAQARGGAAKGGTTSLQTSEQSLLEAEITSLLDQRTDLNSRLGSATVDFINRPRVAQITKPYKVDAPVSPRPLNAAAAGGLAGAVVAAVAVAVLARRRGQTARST